MCRRRAQRRSCAGRSCAHASAACRPASGRPAPPDRPVALWIACRGGAVRTGDRQQPAAQPERVARWTHHRVRRARPQQSGCERTRNVERSTSATGACAWTTKARPLERSTANPGSQLSVTRPLDSVPERISGSAAERRPREAHLNEPRWAHRAAARAEHEQQAAAEALAGLQRPPSVCRQTTRRRPASTPATIVSPAPQQPGVTTTASTRRGPAQAGGDARPATRNHNVAKRAHAAGRSGEAWRRERWNPAPVAIGPGSSSPTARARAGSAARQADATCPCRRERARVNPAS